jgi:hypothetical protein
VFNYDAVSEKFTADPKSLPDWRNACRAAVKPKDYIFHPYEKRRTGAPPDQVPGIAEGRRTDESSQPAPVRSIVFQRTRTKWPDEQLGFCVVNFSQYDDSTILYAPIALLYSLL